MLGLHLSCHGRQAAHCGQLWGVKSDAPPCACPEPLSWGLGQVIWTVLVEALPMVGKNAQQIRAMVLRQVKAYKALLNTFCTNARTEAAFMVHLQARRLPYSCSACTASLSQCALGLA